ncbi:hypothetical protein [Pseudonocardia phyllosphaerae]|uniref:hypothetical protein n=1 Tax=Pseudonocardia phyllosphaerae TaxID=3390502 RepID=UPI00397C90E6
MTTRLRARLAVAAGLLVVLAVAAYAAGGGFRPAAPDSGGPVGSVRLGPDPGQDVRTYLAGLPATLPPAGAPAPALVQLTRPVGVRDAAALAGSVDPAAPAGSADRSGSAGSADVATAVFRVPLTRVQTALRFQPVTGTGDLVAALDVARAGAAHAADADAARADQAVAALAPDAPADARTALARRAAVARAEQRALDDPGCTCVLALVVTADRAGLEALSRDDGVRAVQAAPPGTRPRDLALSPLLPEQTRTVTPPADDGPVPAG